ncbi:RNA pol II accessory factor, Cdc73 family-domain-containing protein [Entophlyctis helioformis]|nr:RNA pol II accessory factor, Cdc73 family-domain-containing protein [Entophlyctis helioformis]
MASHVRPRDTPAIWQLPPTSTFLTDANVTVLLQPSSMATTASTTTTTATNGNSSDSAAVSQLLAVPFVTLLRHAALSGAAMALWTDAACTARAPDQASASHISLAFSPVAVATILGSSTASSSSSAAGSSTARRPLSTTTTTVRLRLADPSGYKDYDCWTVYFFFVQRALEHAAYLKLLGSSAGNKDMVPVSFIDRKDLLDYITGVSPSSNNVRSFVPAKPSAAAAASASVSHSAASALDSAAGAKAAGEPDELLVQEVDRKRKAISSHVLEDYAVVKRICAMERTISTSATILSISGSKTFASIQKLGFDKFIRPKDDKSKSSQSKPGSSKPDPRDPRSQRKPAPSAAPSSSKRPDASTSASKPPKHGKDAIPIIIVPAAAQSLLTLYNVNDLLVKQTFVSNDEYRNRGVDKPTQVILERDPKSIPQGAAKKVLVVDNVDTLKPRDWDRVVAVFTNGQEWQFRGWKWAKPVDIFHNTLGFALKFQDEPAQGLIPTWKVDVLNVSAMHDRQLYAGCPLCAILSTDSCALPVHPRLIERNDTWMQLWCTISGKKWMPLLSTRSSSDGHMACDQ